MEKTKGGAQGLSDTDWKQIQAEYVNGDISLTALADKYGIPKSSVMKHSAKGKWSEKRKKNREDSAELVSEKLRDRNVNQTVRELQRIFKASGRLITQINKAIGQLDKAAYVAKDDLEISTEQTENKGKVTVKTSKKRKMKTARMETIIDSKRAAELSKALLNLKDILTGDTGETEQGETGGVIEIAAATELDEREDNESDLDTAAEASGDDEPQRG